MRMIGLLLLMIILSGCSGLGFDKEATFMPDNMSVSFGEQRLLPFDAEWRGTVITFSWGFK